MNISEVAKLVGLSSKQIRDYEKSGLLKPAQRSLSGYRHYEEKGPTNSPAFTITG